MRVGQVFDGDLVLACHRARRRLVGREAAAPPRRPLTAVHREIPHASPRLIVWLWGTYNGDTCDGHIRRGHIRRECEIIALWTRRPPTARRDTSRLWCVAAGFKWTRRKREKTVYS